MARPARPYARTLASILLEANVVRQDQVEAALIRQRSTGLRIGETLVELGAATEEDIGWALARQLDLPFVDPRPEALDHELIRSFPEGLLVRLDAVPLVREEASLSVALADPIDRDIVEELEQVAGVPLTLAVATSSAIRRVLSEVLGIRRDLRAVAPAPASDARFDISWDRSGEDFLLFHLREAIRAGTDELHFVGRANSLEVHHRLGGRLVLVWNEPPGALAYLLARIEALGGAKLADDVPHVLGHVSCPADDDTVDLAVSLLSREEGASVTVTWKPASTLTQLGDLGLDRADLAGLREALGRPGGLGIVAGPPHAGGSTTLACLLAETGSAGRRCLAFGLTAPLVPEELRVPVPAADAARIWLDVSVAQCADVVILDGVLEGERIRDALSPKAAGRDVLLRTDWTDSFALLEHLATRARDRAAISERLRFVIQQRLLRPDAEMNATNGSRPPGSLFPAFEVLLPTESLREALRAGEPAARLRQCAETAGIYSLTTRLQDLVAAGRVSAAEAGRLVA